MTEMVELKTPVDYLIADGREALHTLQVARTKRELTAREKLAAERKAVWQLVIDKACQQIQEDALHFGFRPTESSPIANWGRETTWNDLYWFLPDVSVPVMIRPFSGNRLGVRVRRAVSVSADSMDETQGDGSKCALLEGRYYFAPDNVQFAPCMPRFDLDWSGDDVYFGVDSDEEWWDTPEIPVYIASTREDDYAKALAERDAWQAKSAEPAVVRVDGMAQRIEHLISLAEAGDAVSAGLAAVALVLREGTLDVKNVDNY